MLSLACKIIHRHIDDRMDVSARIVLLTRVDMQTSSRHFTVIHGISHISCYMKIAHSGIYKVKLR